MSPIASTVKMIRCTLCGEWIGDLKDAEIKCPDLHVGWRLRCRKCIEEGRES